MPRPGLNLLDHINTTVYFELHDITGIDLTEFLSVSSAPAIYGTSPPLPSPSTCPHCLNGASPLLSSPSTRPHCISAHSAGCVPLRAIVRLVCPAGVATFSGVRINRTGEYYLTAAASLAGENGTSASAAGNSSAFAVVLPPQLNVTVVSQPTAVVATVFFNVSVSVADAFGNVNVGDSDSVLNVSLTTDASPGLNASLLGTASLRLSFGRALFQLSLDKVGAGFVLSIVSGNPLYYGALSLPITVSLSPPAALAVLRQPQGNAINVLFTVQPLFALLDFGN